MVIVTSGYFDPIHVGHIEYLNAAKMLGNKLIVLVNSDSAAIRKKGYVFMSQIDRIKIISELRCVDEVIPAIDNDDTIAENLKIIKPDIFAKGGDRDIQNLPVQELEVCRILGIKIVTGLGSKIASSSALVERFKKVEGI